MTRAATAGEHVEIAPMKTGCALLLLALGAAFPVANAQTEKWPNKPVRVMVPGAPGGTSDIIARLLAPRLTEEFGQQFIIDNRPGAGGSIAAAIAARATSDGYTIAEVTSSYSAFAALHPLPYDPVKGIAPITMIGIVPFILVVHPSVKASNVGEFIELARSQPGALAFGSSGIGGTPHLAFALLQQMTRTHMHHVPYKSEPTSIADLIGGQIQARISTGLSLGPHISTGKLRALAVTTERRSPAMPDLPAISEWVPGYAVDGWSGIWAPAGTPRKIVARLNQALARILKLPDVQERLRAVGMDPAPFAPEEFARVIARDIAMWTKVIKAANIKIE